MINIKYKNGKFIVGVIIVVGILFSNYTYNPEKKELREQIESFMSSDKEVEKIQIVDNDNGVQKEINSTDKMAFRDKVKNILLNHCKLPGNKQYMHTASEYIGFLYEDGNGTSLTIFENRIVIGSSRMTESIWMDLDFIGRSKLYQLMRNI